MKLNTERDILRAAAEYFAGDELVSRFQFVADHRDTFEVKWLCEIIEVARSLFYAWFNAVETRTARTTADDALAQRIRGVHTTDSTYGAPRINAKLNDGAPEAERVNHKRVGPGDAHRGDRRLSAQTAGEDHRARSGESEGARSAGPGLHGPVPNTKYVGDITYLPLATGGNLYLATVIDCCSRWVAGWAIAEHMRTELIEDALKAAGSLRGGVTGSVFHSDHGS